MVLAKSDTAKSVECMNVLELLLLDAEHSRLKVFDLIMINMSNGHTKTITRMMTITVTTT